MVFENRVLRCTFEPHRDENCNWSRLHNEEPHSFHCSHNIVSMIKYRILRLAGHVVRMEESRSAFKILTGKPSGKRSLGRLRLK